MADVFGHHPVEQHAVDPRGRVPDEEGEAGIAAIGRQCPVAETLHHSLDQTTLNRIVIDDQHHFRHDHSKPDIRTQRTEDLCRFGAM
jgi:hypothetical protein